MERETERETAARDRNKKQITNGDSQMRPTDRPEAATATATAAASSDGGNNSR